MAGKLMHAVQYDGYGGGASRLKHVKIPIPSPQKGEVLIKLEVVSLNPADWKIQKGMLRPVFPGRFPFIPATDVAGKISAVGPEVTDFKEGDDVVTLLSSFKGGGLAEYAVASANLTIKRPPELPAAESSGLCIAGLTALQALTSLGTKFDGTDKPLNILVTAASGGVGHYAVQLAKLVNYHVTATCGSRNLELVKDLGADEVLDYKTPEGASLKSTSGKKYDAVISCATGIPWSVADPILSERGRVIDIAPSVGSFFTGVLKKLTFSKKQIVMMIMAAKAKNLGFLVDLAKEGKIKTVIDSRFPLSKVEEAWSKCMEGHATGKIVVEFSEDSN